MRGEFQQLLIDERDKVKVIEAICDKHQVCMDFNHSKKRKQK